MRLGTGESPVRLGKLFLTGLPGAVHLTSK